MYPTLSGTLGRIPERRVRLLERTQLHRDVVVPVVPALEGQPLLGQPCQDDRQRLVEDRARLAIVDPEVAKLVRRDATADAQLEPTTREVVEHADLLDEPQRVVERQDVDERSQADPAGALGCRREKQARRGGHAERRGVMLCQVVGVEASGLRRLHELQPLLVELLHRCAAPVDPVEQSEGHVGHAVPPLDRRVLDEGMMLAEPSRVCAQRTTLSRRRQGRTSYLGVVSLAGYLPRSAT